MKTLNNVISKQVIFSAINNLHKNGLPAGITTGVNNLDNIFRFDKGKLAVITGIPNMGKSEFLDFICCQMNKLHGLKTLYYSPENQPLELHISKLFSKFSNMHFDAQIEEKDYTKIVNHIANNFFFLNYENIFTLDDVLNEAENMIIHSGIDVLVIDSYNKLEAQKDYNITETDYISKVLDRLERFAKKNNVLVFLVAHPRKMAKDSNENYQIPSPYDINGSANFYNKADYCVTVHRNKGEKISTIRIDKVKFKNYGAQAETRLLYDYASGNYYNAKDSDIDELFGDNDNNNNNVTEYIPYPFVIPDYNNNNNEEKIDWLSSKVSYFFQISDTTPKECELKEMLFDSQFITDNKHKIDRLRNEKKEDRRKSHKGCLPNFTISCTFTNKRDSKDVKSVNNLICIDIDKKDNLGIIDKVPDIIKSLDNVLYASKSCSGQGYYCIIPIEDTSRFKDHFLSLESDFIKLGITIDKACKDVTRTRFISYDDEYYYNPDAEIYKRYKSTKDKDNKEAKERVKNGNKGLKRTNNKDVDKVKEILKDCQVNNIDITDGYANWFNICMSLIATFGEAGKEYFHAFSKINNQYNESDTDTLFDNCLSTYEESNDYTIATLINRYKECKGS